MKGRQQRKVADVQAKRLLHYGPYADKDTAERKIEQLRRTAGYRKVNLVASNNGSPTRASK